MIHARVALLLLLMSLCLGQLLSAAIICGSEADSSAKSSEPRGSEKSTTEATVTPKPSELNQLLHSMQCTLEKAKPWIADLEKEAKRLEETAKRVGLSIVHRFGDLMTTLLGTVANKNHETGAGAVTEAEDGQRNGTSPIPPSIDVVNNVINVQPVTLSTDSPSIGIAANEAENEITGVV